LEGGKAGNDHTGQGDVHGVSVTEAHSADYKIPSGEVGDGPQEGNFQADDGLDGLSDAGSLNSEEEHELEEYFKKIKEEKGKTPTKIMACCRVALS
jgi:hypothetical protein